MKKLFILGLLAFAGFRTIAQSSDTSLNNRLDTYMRLNRELQFERIMDYVHPSLFQHSSRGMLVQAFKQAYDNEESQIRIDSAFITAISPDFKVGNASYRKVDYGMAIHLRIKDSSMTNDPFSIEKMGEALQVGFPNGRIRFDKATTSFAIEAEHILMAIKDNESSQWMFLGYQKNEGFLKALFPQQVIDHFKLL